MLRSRAAFVLTGLCIFGCSDDPVPYPAHGAYGGADSAGPGSGVLTGSTTGHGVGQGGGPIGEGGGSPGAVGGSAGVGATSNPAATTGSGSIGGSSSATGSPNVTSASSTGTAVSTVASGGVAPEPIYAPADTWTWVDVPGTRCFFGTGTGLAVNLHEGASKVLILLDSGGGCFNAATVGTLENYSWGPTELATWAPTRGTTGPFERGNPENPFRDWNYVLIPDCSGDAHAGNGVTGPDASAPGVTQVGYPNFIAFMERIVPTFDGQEIVLAGSSAGGLGAFALFDKIIEMFPNSYARGMISDSGAFFSDTYFKPCLQKRIRAAYGLSATIPDECVACDSGDGGLANIMPFIAQKYPDRRFGLILSEHDSVGSILLGFGYGPICGETPGVMPPEEYTAAATELRASMAPSTNFRSFYTSVDKHIFFRDPLTATQSAGVTLAQWLTGFLDPTATWSDIGP